MNANNETAGQHVRSLLDAVLRQPAAIVQMHPAEIDLVLRVARRSRLLGRIAVDLQESGILETLPFVVQDQLRSFQVLAASRASLASWELDRIAWALKDEHAVPLVLMKGCAYIALDLPNTGGRFFADVDLLLPEEQLERIEALLNSRGWQTGKLSPYDQNYYRLWTHELPPITHVEREVEIDLHHNIVPRTSRLKPKSDKLLATIQPVAGSRYHTLANEDIVLHAMTHLMFDGDLGDKLRDLVDIDDLVRHFAARNTDFWNDLQVRARELDLVRPAFYSLRYIKDLLGCPVPQSVIEASHKWAPPWPVVWLMDRLVLRALYPSHPDFPARFTGFCRILLYVRSHWIRMPPWLLAYHLGHKFLFTRLRRK